MPTSVTWNGTVRSIPNAGELSWQALTGFLSDLGNNAQTTNFQKVGMRVATSTPVTVSSSTDCVVVTDLTVAGAVAVNLPAGVTGQMFTVVDGKGDAATNNITITPASGNINGAATYVINGNRNGVVFAYNGTSWTILSEFIASGTAGSIPRDQIAAGSAGHVIINDGSGVLSSEAQLAVTRGGTGQSTATAAFNALSPITTRGDLITNDGTNDTRLAVGSANRVLSSDGTDPSWTLIVNSNVDVAAAIARTKLASGTADHVIINNGSGVLSSEAQLAVTRGGTGVSTSTGTGSTVLSSAPTLSAANLTGTTVVKTGNEIHFEDDDGSARVALGAPSVVTANRDVNFPDASGTLVLTDSTQVLTNKDIDGGTASNARRITVPKDTLANLTALTRKEGTIVYATDTDKFYSDNGTVLTEVGSGAGSGEKNYVTNPSASTGTTGWANVGDLDIVRTTTASELPREFTTATGFKITADSNTQSVADYVYYDFTLDDVDLSKKLKISWSQKVTGTYSAGQLAVVITTQADRTTALHTPIVTSIPASDGVFTTSFDAGTTATLSLVIRATADMTTDGGIVISDVVVGPGTPIQGAVVSEWVSYTPTGAWVTNTTYAGKWRRVGDSMEVEAQATLTGAPTTAAFTLTIPSGHTIDASKTANGTLGTGLQAYGSGHAFDSGTRVYPLIVTQSSTSTTTVTCYSAETTGSTSSQVEEDSPFTFGSADSVRIRFTVPIAEWSGSGVVNLSQNDVEYAYNTGTWGSTNTTSFAYGAGGQLMGGAVAGSFNHRVRFNTPIQATDTLVLEFSFDRVSWFPAANAHINGGNVINMINSTGSAASGAWIRGNVGNSTDVDAHFAQYMQMENDDGAPVNWPSSNGYWRIKKAASASAVGFGLVAQGSSGLVKSAGQLLGTNTNDVAETGFVGEVLTATGGSVSLTSGQYNDATSALTLTAGCWDVFGALRFTPAATTVISNIAYGLGTASGNSSAGLVQSQNSLTEYFPTSYVPRDEVSRMTPTYRVNVATTATYYLKALASFSVSTCNTNSGFIRATRVR